MPRGTRKANGAAQAGTDPVISASPANTTKVTLTLSKELHAQAEAIANHPDEERTVPNMLLRMLRKDIAIRYAQMFPTTSGAEETEVDDYR